MLIKPSVVLVAIAAPLLGPDVPAAEAADIHRSSPGEVGSDGRSYIVRLVEPALASYTGGIAGLAPTSPPSLGRHKLDPGSPASRAYLDYLEKRHKEVIAAITERIGRRPRIGYRYRVVLNGLAMTLSASEAERVLLLPGVATVTPDELHHPTAESGSCQPAASPKVPPADSPT